MIALPPTAACFQTNPSGICVGQMLSSSENPILIWNQCNAFSVLIAYALLQNTIAEETTKKNSQMHPRNICCGYLKVVVRSQIDNYKVALMNENFLNLYLHIAS